MEFPTQILNELLISYTNGGTAVQIGPGATLQFYDTSGNLIASISPPTGVDETIVKLNQGTTTFEINNQAGDGVVPGIDWITPGGDAFINIVPDSNNVPQIGINSGIYTNPSGRQVKERLYMANGAVQLGSVTVAGQLQDGGVVYANDGSSSVTHNTNGVTTASITVSQNKITRSVGSGLKQGVTQVQSGNYSIDRISNESWNAPTFINGWSNFGPPWSSLGFTREPHGVIRMRGLIKPGTVTNPVTVATITGSDYIPLTNKFLPVICDYDGGNPNIRAVIDTTGNITVYGLVTTADVSFDGLTYEIY